jgi:hypothetical protein
MTTTTPHYVVKKIGDQFVTIRQEEVDPATTTLFAVGGLWTALWGVKHRGLIGLGAIGLGACLVYRGFTGRSLIDRVTCGSCGSAKRGNSNDSPSFQHEHSTESSQLPADEVDEMSMESFPASDPPARHSSTATT